MFIETSALGIAVRNELVQVPFHGDVIEAVKDEKGVVWVPIKRPCESFGLDFSAQLKRLKEQSWATVAVIATVAEDGKLREVAATDLDGLPIWLATIQASRVKEEIRPKLVIYQKEAAKVLAAHFLGKKTAHEIDLGAMAVCMSQVAGSVAQMAAACGQLMERVAALEKNNAVGPHEVGLRERLRAVWPTANEKTRKRVIDQIQRGLARHGILPFKLVPNGPNVVHRNHVGLVDEIIRRSRQQMEDRETFPIVNYIDAQGAAT